MQQKPNIDEAFQTLNPDAIIEIGTAAGGLTRLLHGQFPGVPIVTVDVQAPDEPFRRGVTFLHGDCFHLEILDRNISGNLLFLCDGGDKKREFNHFAPGVPSGTLIGLHDYEHPGRPTGWNTVEVRYEDIEATVRKEKLEEVSPDLWASFGWGMFRKP